MDRLSAKSYVGQLLPYQPSPNPNSTFFISTWHAPCKLLAPSAKLVQNDGEKTHFTTLLLPKQRIVSFTSRLLISLKFEHET